MFKHYFLAFAKSVSSLLMKIPEILHAILRKKKVFIDNLSYQEKGIYLTTQYKGSD